MKRRAQTELIDSNLAPKFWTDVQISLPSIPRQAEAGAERLTKYFSDANVVNLVGWVWQTPPPSPPTCPHPSGTVAWCQTDLPSPRSQPASHLAKLLEDPAIFYEIISDHLCSVSRAPHTMCVIRPLVPHC